MKTVNIAITFETSDCLSWLHQIEEARRKYVPLNIEVNEVSFEKEWIPGKTRISFRGAEK